MSSHDHPPHHHAPAHGHGTLLPALLLTLACASLGALAGWWAGSLSLLASAALMAVGGLTLAIDAAALRFAPPAGQTEAGPVPALLLLIRAFTALTTVLIVGFILWQALERLSSPHPVSAEAVIAVALLGIAINLYVARRLTQGEPDLDPAASRWPALSSALGSAVALLSGLLLLLSGQQALDPLLALLLCGLLLAAMLWLLHRAASAAPDPSANQPWLIDVGTAMMEVEGVSSVSHLHIWNPGPDTRALSGHVVLARDEWSQILPQLQSLLDERFGIRFTTLEPEQPPRKIIRFTPPKDKSH